MAPRPAGQAGRVSPHSASLARLRRGRRPVRQASPKPRCRPCQDQIPKRRKRTPTSRTAALDLGQQGNGCSVTRPDHAGASPASPLTHLPCANAQCAQHIPACGASGARRGSGERGRRRERGACPAGAAGPRPDRAWLTSTVKVVEMPAATSRERRTKAGRRVSAGE